MSTGLNCEFVCVYCDENSTRAEWYYILEHSSAPKNADNWREYASAFGPFATEDDADRHLSRHHANPGSSTTRHLLRKDLELIDSRATIKILLEEAPRNKARGY